MVNGPANWGRLGTPPTWPECTGLGFTQSPAALTNPTFGDIGPLTLTYQPTAVAMANNGRSIKSIPTAPQSITLKNEDPLPLKEFHFHVPAEHTLPGVKAVAELHLVHGGDNGSVPTAIAVLLVETRQPNGELDAILDAVSTIPMCSQKENVADVDLKKLVPQALAERFLQYDGSLTTPPCSKVRWLILTSPIPISKGQLARLNLFGANARPTTGMPAKVLCWPAENCRVRRSGAASD